jgi:hypothetical protein
MLKAPERNGNAFRLAGAAAGEQNVKWVVALRPRGRSSRGDVGKFCDVFRREK